MKDKLLKYGLLEATTEALLWKRIMSDYKCQLSHKGSNGDIGKFISMKKESQQDMLKNFYTIPYLLHAYDAKQSNFQNKRRADKNGVSNFTDGIKKRVQYNKGDCVITNRAASRRQYNAHYCLSMLKALAGSIPIFMHIWHICCTIAQIWFWHYLAIVKLFCGLFSSNLGLHVIRNPCFPSLSSPLSPASCL